MVGSVPEFIDVGTKDPRAFMRCETPDALPVDFLYGVMVNHDLNAHPVFVSALDWDLPNDAAMPSTGPIPLTVSAFVIE